MAQWVELSGATVGYSYCCEASDEEMGTGSSANRENLGLRSG
jgi:hypothetical protein